MDIEALRSFLAFVETGSFTRAAKQINRTQSAFSAQMRKLEEELNVSLFEKEGRNLVLSEAGLSLRTHAEQLVSLHNKAIKQVQRYEDKRPFRLGCPDDYHDKILPNVVKALQITEPTCSIHIFSQPSVTLRAWLDEGKIDAAIVTRSPNSEEGYWLAKDHGVWVAHRDIEFNDAQPLPLALFQTDCKYHAAAIDGLTKNSMPYHLVACCSSSSGLNSMVKSGIAVGAMGQLSMAKNLRILDNMPPLPVVDIVLITGAQSHPLLDKESLDHLTRFVSNN
ncbi:LysR family transcriptional regulator [Vibrio sp. RC27]